MEEEVVQINTKLYAAFPGTGKSHFFEESKDSLNILDSDSSTFDKSEFPQNYIDHIKENIGKADIIMISSHDVVRNALVENDIDFTLIYPHVSLKEEYVQRYKDRGNADAFIELLEANWETWINECEFQQGCDKIVLDSYQYLSEVI